VKEIVMRTDFRAFGVAAFVLSASFVRAQTVADPSGHWDGALEAPGTTVSFQVDLAKNRAGRLGGTITIPSQHITGLPLTKVVVDGTSVVFSARTDQQLTGSLSPDGASMSGTFAMEGFSIPFTIARTGDARIEPPPRSAPVGTELEGSWTGTLGVGGGLRLVLKISNEPDGTSTGLMTNLDEGGIEIPVTITQKGSGVTIDSTVVVASFSGTLNADGTELAGTLHQAAIEVPLTFRKAPDGKR
jgi:hypothetical protein